MGWGPFGAPGWGYDMVSPPGPNFFMHTGALPSNQRPAAASARVGGAAAGGRGPVCLSLRGFVKQDMFQDCGLCWTSSGERKTNSVKIGSSCNL